MSEQTRPTVEQIARALLEAVHHEGYGRPFGERSTEERQEWIDSVQRYLVGDVARQGPSLRIRFALAKRIAELEIENAALRAALDGDKRSSRETFRPKCDKHTEGGHGRDITDWCNWKSEND